MAYFVKCSRFGDQEVSSTAIGTTLPADTPDYFWIEVPESIYQPVTSEMTWEDDGPKRWHYDGSTISELADPRPVARLEAINLPPGRSVVTLPDGTLFLELDVGDVSPTLRVTRLNAQGNTATGFTASVKMKVLDYTVSRNRLVRMDFTAGVATKAIPTSQPREIRLRGTSQYRFEARMIIRIDDTEL